MAISDIAGNALPAGQGGQMIGFIEPPAASEVLPLKAYRFLIEPIRTADLNDGALFLQRFIDGYQQVWVDQQAAIFGIEDLWSVTKIADAYLPYLKNIVGWTKVLDHITAQLDAPTLRRLIASSVALWKSRGPEDAIINIIRLVTTARLRLWNWFGFRWITDETGLGEEHEGSDPWAISLPGEADKDEYWSNLRIVDDGTLNRQLVEDLVKLMRAVSERIEISYIDFLDLFQTDDDNNQWTAYDGNRGLVKSGRMSLLNSASRERIVTTLAASFLWTEYVATWRVRGTAQFGGMFYVQDALNYYTAFIDIATNQLKVAKNVAGTPTTLATYDFIADGQFIANTWYAIRVHVGPDTGGTRIRAYLDNAILIDYTDTSTPFTKGALGFFHLSGGTAEMDDVEMFQLPLDETLIDVNS